jgi:hypothetical protein
MAIEIQLDGKYLVDRNGLRLAGDLSRGEALRVDACAARGRFTEKTHALLLPWAQKVHGVNPTEPERNPS